MNDKAALVIQTFVSFVLISSFPPSLPPSLSSFSSP
jgi:hypothetical protein